MLSGPASNASASPLSSAVIQPPRCEAIGGFGIVGGDEAISLSKFVSRLRASGGSPAG